MTSRPWRIAISPSYEDLVKVRYMVVEEETGEIKFETYDISIAMDFANQCKKRHLVISEKDYLLWNTEWNDDSYHWKVKRRNSEIMEKLIILDYSDSSVHIFDIDNSEGKLVVDEEYIEEMGFKASNCSWMQGDIETTYHRDSFTSKEE